MFCGWEAYKIWWKSLKDRLRNDGKIILKWILKKVAGRLWDVEWMHVTQDRNKFQKFVKTVMKIRFPQSAENFLSS